MITTHSYNQTNTVVAQVRVSRAAMKAAQEAAKAAANSDAPAAE